MKSKSRTRSRRAPKSPVVRPALPTPEPESSEFEAPQLEPYVIVAQRSERGKRVREQAPRPEPELEEMSPVVPLLFIIVPLVLVIVYGVLSTWLKF